MKKEIGLTIYNKGTGKQTLREIDMIRYTKLIQDAVNRGFTFEYKTVSVKFYHDDYTHVYTACVL